MGQIATVEMMYVIQNLINLVIPSGSAKAALTIPIMAPFSDLIGLSKQATVMAFQFGIYQSFQPVRFQQAQR